MLSPPSSQTPGSPQPHLHCPSIPLSIPILQRREEEGQLEAPGWRGLCHLTSADSSGHHSDPNVSVVLLSLCVCVPAPCRLLPASSVGNSQACRQREAAADFCVFPSHRLWCCLLHRLNLDPSPKISSGRLGGRSFPINLPMASSTEAAGPPGSSQMSLTWRKRGGC